MCKNCFDQKNKTLYHGTCKKCGSDVERFENLYSGYVFFTCPTCKKTVESCSFYTVFDDETSNPDCIPKAKKQTTEPHGGAWGAARAVKNAGHLGVELYEQFAEGLL